MTQRLVVAVVARLWRLHETRSTALEVTAELEALRGTEVDRADVSRTLLRAERNGRLSRREGHTTEGGWFHYEYAPTEKGLAWLDLLRVRRREEASRRTTSQEVAQSGMPSPGLGLAIDESTSASGADASCGDCGQSVSPDGRYCRHCGVELETCDECERLLIDGGCENCGG